MTENPDKSCSRCGTPILVEAPGGLCPRCLMAMNFDSYTMPGGEQAPHSPPLTPEELAEKFPQYEILECLGRGGMGVVYKARQKSLDRMVAIKILPPERVGEEKFFDRFATEAATLAKLSHPNIVTVHDFGETSGLFYIVMEYVDGVNLRDLLREGKLEPQHALAIVPPICDALQYAHGKGIVHRDIKPENLLLDKDGRVKIADFGIASLVGAAGEVAGTPPYMAPEQGTSRNGIDPRTDIYALGVVLYEMLTGERPGKDLVAPSKKVRIDVRLDEMVLRALETEPERRYQTAGEFRTAVETLGDSAQLLKSDESLYATPEFLSTVWGAAKLHQGLGSLRLFSDRLEFQAGLARTVIPLAAISRLDLIGYPFFQSPAGLRSIELQYEEAGTSRRLILTPVRGRIVFAGSANRRAAEWLAAIQEAARSKTGALPAGSPSPVPYQGFSRRGRWLGASAMLAVFASAIVALAALFAKMEGRHPMQRDSFGRTESLTVPEPLAGTACLLDFETGQLLVPPEGLARKMVAGESRLEAADVRWLRETGADAALHMPGSQARPGLRLFEGMAFSLSRNQKPPLKFGSFSSADVIEAIHAAPFGNRFRSAEGESFFHVASSPGPAAMAFVTREGTTGVLEILGRATKPPGVKIRYKLVRNPGQAQVQAPLLPPGYDRLQGGTPPPPPAYGGPQAPGEPSSAGPEMTGLKPIPQDALRAFEDYARFHQTTAPRDMARSEVWKEQQALESRWKESLRGTICQPFLDRMEALALDIDSAKRAANEDEVQRLDREFGTLGNSLSDMLVDAGMRWPGLEEFSLRWVALPDDRDTIRIPGASPGAGTIRVARKALLTPPMLATVGWSKSGGGSKELFLTLRNDEDILALHKRTSERIGDRLAVVWRGRAVSVIKVEAPLSNGLTIPLAINDADASALERELKHAADAP